MLIYLAMLGGIVLGSYLIKKLSYKNYNRMSTSLLDSTILVLVFLAGLKAGASLLTAHNMSSAIAYYSIIPGLTSITLALLFRGFRK